ncbi:MAG: HIT family protein [Glaciimonas sp.]|nr:HIT family protein [Glaciimonas sp.]
MTTIFEKILLGEIPGVKIYEDDLVFAFMDAGQVNPGHVLVATKKPYETLMDADADSVVALMRVAHKIAKAIQIAFQPEGITLLQTNKPAGWQTVPHLHMHVVPRFSNDGASLVWPRNEPGIEKLREYASKIQVI